MLNVIIIIALALIGIKLLIMSPKAIAAVIVRIDSQILKARLEKTGQKIIEYRSETERYPDPWAKPSRAERNLLRAGLKQSIDLTVLKSYYPGIA
jgi:hypothetical protein